MQKIDSHQHFWLYHPVKDSWITDEMHVIQKDFMPVDLATQLQETGVNGCITVQADQSEAETMFLLEQARNNTFVKGIVGWIDLQAAHIEERLAHFSDYPGIKGFRHIVEAEPDVNFLLGERFRNGISLLNNYNFTYDLLLKPAQLEAASRLIKAYPDQRFVVDHMAKPDIRSKDFSSWKARLSAIAESKNVYCKVSGFGTQANWQNWGLADVKPYFDVVFEIFEIDRVMFGSDWPVCLLAGSYQKTIEVLEGYLKEVSQQDQEKFWAQNAIDFYGLAV